MTGWAASDQEFAGGLKLPGTCPLGALPLPAEAAAAQLNTSTVSVHLKLVVPLAAIPM
jgi:hypothetical protein